MHPAVKAWLAEGYVARFLNQLPEPLDPSMRAHRDVVNSIVTPSRESKEQALSMAEEALGDIKDPLYAILFCSHASFTALLAGRFSEAWAYYHRAHSLLRHDMPAEFKAGNISLRSRIVGAEGNKTEEIRLIKQALAALPPSSPHYVRILSSLGLFLAELGQEIEIDNEYSKRVDRATVNQARVIQYVETGRFAEARKLRPRVAELNELYRLDFEAIPDHPPPWAQVIDRLMRRRPKEALELARRNALEDPERYLARPTLESFNLVRAELSNGNGDTAWRLMKLRHQRGNVHFIDDLFLSRIEWLAGRKEESARGVLRLLESADRYQAHGRIDFELRMSCELSAVDWLQILRPRSGRKSPSARAEKTVRGVDRLVGKSRAIQEIRKTVKRFAALDAIVLITGETGTGKEIVARALHEESPKTAEPLVAINCGAISESLLESELFGYERGAFTGAESARAGFIEQAGRGTLVLDEIGDISPRLQVALLRVLESREFYPVGGRKPRRMECRIIASTNRNLKNLRPDLLYRLRQLEIHIPPLHDRPEDIMALARHFLNSDRPREVTIDPSLQRVLTRHVWPGNVRELRHEIERMRLLHPDLLVYKAEHLPRTFEDRPAERLWGAPNRRLAKLKELFQEHEKLTRKEISKILGVSVETANQDLRRLIEEGFIDRVSPSASSRTNYFQKR